MRVLVTGAYGLIGSAVLARLHRDGHEVTGAGRDVRGAERRASFAKWITTDFRRLTLAGAFFLVVIAVIPVLLYKQLNISQNISQFFGGTSILIAVGVLLNTMRQVESHLMMRHYDGFLKKGRLRGRF